MKSLKYLIYATALTMTFALHANDSSKEVINDDFQNGFNCTHSSESDPTPVVFLMAAGYLADQTFCESQHAALAAQGGHRDDKGGNPENCEVGYVPLD